MVVLGLFLLVLAGALTAAMVLQNTDASSASAFGQAVTGTTGTLFLAGVITGAVALLGVMLMMAGLSRRRGRRRGLKQQVRAERGEKETLAEENARLRRELDGSRSDADVYPDEDAPAGRHSRAGLFHR
jgi:membrane protein implicated in regulation of membrane protease activity